MKLSDRAKEAASAHCDLNILYAVIAILEGGTISAHCNRDAEAIIKRCQSGAQKALRRYDRHMDAIKQGGVQ